MLYVREAYNMVQSLCTWAIEPHHVRRLYVFPNCERRLRKAGLALASDFVDDRMSRLIDFNPATPATGSALCTSAFQPPCSRDKVACRSGSFGVPDFLGASFFIVVCMTISRIVLYRNLGICGLLSHRICYMYVICLSNI